MAALYPSSLERADPSPGFEYVLYVDSPEGQLSFHVADSDLDLFKHVRRNVGRHWDKTDLTYQRIEKLVYGQASQTHLRLSVELRRLERAKCMNCGRRRVLYALATVGGSSLTSMSRGRCADCAGAR